MTVNAPHVAASKILGATEDAPVAHGYYDPDRERWVTAAEQQQEYDDEMEACQVDEDIRRQQEAENQDAGLTRASASPWLRTAVAIAAPLAMPLEDDGMLSARDCIGIADTLRYLRCTTEDGATRDDYRRWERLLRDYAVTLTGVQTARTIPVAPAAAPAVAQVAA